MTWGLFAGPAWSRVRPRLYLTFALALASHGLLDALSMYSVGVEFFAPFSQRRYLWPWTPLGPNGGWWGGMLQEGIVVLLPMALVTWLGYRVRQRRR